MTELELLQSIDETLTLIYHTILAFTVVCILGIGWIAGHQR